MNYASIEGLRIVYDHRRPPSGDGRGRGRVIYIHGTGCTGRVFERHLAVVAAEHEVVAIDLPGHGESEGSGFRGVADHAFFTAGLIEHLGWERCVVAGHSLGGGIALAVAVYFPELVEGLLLIDTGARLRVDPAIIETARRTAAGRDIAAGDPRRGFAQRTSQAVVDETDILRGECSPEVTYKDWIADDSFDFMSRLPHILVPSLAVCGDEDEFTPVKYHEYFRDKLPDCRLEIISGAGHWPFVEQPDTFDRCVLRFLDELARKRAPTS